MTSYAYRDRGHAGEVLAQGLAFLSGQDAKVLAIPNGGVEVALPVAHHLGAPLSLLLVRKIQIPGNTEAGFGALGQDGTTVYNRALMEHLGLTLEMVRRQEALALASLEERARAYGRWAALPDLAGAVAVLVDDGLASGATMEAAVGIVRKKGPQRVVVASPTASGRAYERLQASADDVVVPQVRRGPRFAVAEAYQRWYDVSTRRVQELLGE